MHMHSDNINVELTIDLLLVTVQFLYLVAPQGSTFSSLDTSANYHLPYMVV